MDSHNSEQLDASLDLATRDSASGLVNKPASLPPPLMSPVRPQHAFQSGHFIFSAEQLDYVLVNSRLARGINTARDILLVLKYKWPNQFRLLQEPDLEMVIELLGHGFSATRPDVEMVIRRLSPNFQAMRTIERLNDDRPSGEGGNIDYYMRVQTLDPGGRWYRLSERELYTSRPSDMTQLVNTFRTELREAEVCSVRATASRVEDEVVTAVLASKLFLHLSVKDIALGLTSGYSKVVRGYRYVWMMPFTEKHVEIIWSRSKQAQTKSFKELAESDRGGFRVRRLLGLMRAVKAARADQTSILDPRSCGNETSAVDLVEEIMYLFQGRVDSKDILGAQMTEQGMHGSIDI